MLTQPRFDINDRKGLEIVILTALLTFQDSNEAYHTPPSESSSTFAPSGGISGLFGPRRSSDPAINRQISDSDAAPALPPRPAPRTGVDGVAEAHALRAAQGEGEANEIRVAEEGTVEDYAEYTERLLNVCAFNELQREYELTSCIPG